MRISVCAIGNVGSLVPGGISASRWTATTVNCAFTHFPKRSASDAQHVVRHKVTLRPYQEECIKAVTDHLGKGHKRLGISLATGAGKTVIFTHLIDRVPTPTPDATKTLIIAHRRELVEQAAQQCRNTYANKTVEIDMARQRASGDADITVASVSTLGNTSASDRLMRLDPAHFKLVIVDEAHHIVGKTYMNVLQHFGLHVPGGNGNTAVVGVSATFARHDGRKLGQAIDYIVYHKDYLQMMDEKILAPAIFTTVRTEIDLSKVKDTAGDFRIGALSRVVNNPATNTITVRSWLERARTRKSTLVFCVDVQHVCDMQAMFLQHGIEARSVVGTTKNHERAEILRAFKHGEFPVLLNCGVFTEGTDAPNIDCVLLARPTKSTNLLVQMIGRGLRMHEGKKNCHIIDMVASLKSGIVTAPTLFGLDPDESVQGLEYSQMRSLKQHKQIGEKAVDTGEPTSSELEGNVTFTDYEDVNDLVADTTGERHIRAMSRNAWVKVAPGNYILLDRTGAYISIRHNTSGADGHKTPWLLQSTPIAPAWFMSKSPYARNRPIGAFEDLNSAIRGADTFANETFTQAYIATRAPFRMRAATEKQLNLLNKYRKPGEKLQPGSITLGRAADMITKIMHGAQGRFNRMQMQKQKAEKEDVKQKQRKGAIEVGPVQIEVSVPEQVSQLMNQ